MLAQKPRELLLVLHTGRTVAEGTLTEVLTPALIEDVHGVNAEVVMGRGIR